MNTKKHKKIERVTKPYMRGDMIDRSTLPGALKFFLATLGVAVVFLLVGVMMNWESKLFSILINGVIIIAAFLIFHQTGTTAGADAVNQGEIMLARQEKGRPVEEWERKQCYHPLKGFISALIGSLPLFICALLLACVAQRQVSNLGRLPDWVSGMADRPEIGPAIAYYYDEGGMTLESTMRLIVRMTTMPYVNMIGADSKDGMLLLERISPLLNLLPAFAYGLGYMQGTFIRDAVHTNIALGKKKQQRKLKKERRARQQRMSGPEQLN